MQKNLLSIIHLEDDPAQREDMQEFLGKRLKEALIADASIEIKSAYDEQKAIDAISVAEGKRILLSDLQIGGQYTFKAMRYAAENGVPIIIVSGYPIKEGYTGTGYERGLANLKKDFPEADLDSFYKMQRDPMGKLSEIIRSKFPRFFKKESEKRDIDRGKRL